VDNFRLSFCFKYFSPAKQQQHDNIMQILSVRQMTGSKKGWIGFVKSAFCKNF